MQPIAIFSKKVSCLALVLLVFLRICHSWRLGQVGSKKTRNVRDRAPRALPVASLSTLLFASTPQAVHIQSSTWLREDSKFVRKLGRCTACRMESANFGRVYGLAGQLGGPAQSLLDTYAKVKFDDATGKEYWDIAGVEILRKDESLTEIAFGGLVAGILVEFAVAFLCYPFDTIKTRLQADQKEDLEEYPIYDRLYDGFGAVAFEVPALSVFWAVRDLVRTEVFRKVTGLSFPWTDAVATGLGSLLAEAIVLLLFVTPSEVIKTQRQASVLEEVAATMTAAHVAAPHETNETSTEDDLIPVGGDELHGSAAQAGFPEEAEEEFASWRVDEMNIFGSSPGQIDAGLYIQQILNAFPVLALVDVPYVGLRVLLFIALHDSGLIPSGVVEDTLTFLVANIVAVALTTPLDVVRTRMLLRGSPIQELPAVVAGIYEDDGLVGFTAGSAPRFLYSGLIVGLVLGFVRQSYAGIRASFFVDFLYRLETLNLGGNLRFDTSALASLYQGLQ